MEHSGPSRPARVLVVDDQPLVRGGIVRLLSTEPGLEVVAEAVDGEDAVARARRLQPDVVLMDLRMPGVDGVEATRRLVAEPVDPDRLLKVLVLTTFNDDESVFGALRAGASGFLVKDQAPDHLVQAVRAVAAGDSWIDSTIAARVLRALAAVPRVGPAADALVARLTTREQEVLVLMASGLSNGDISQRLVLSEATVRTHVSRILMKTGSRDRTQSVVLAYQSGLVRVPPSPHP